MKKKVIFIGNRYGVLSVLLEKQNEFDCDIWALEGSYLNKELDNQQLNYKSFGLKDKKKFIQYLTETEFDLLISNGCPFILPISSLHKNGRLFINIHPTFLPFLKGKTAINGVFYNEMNFFGATVHFMDDGIDTGRVINQEKIEVTDDLDLGLLYYLSFKLEQDAFVKALKLLKDSGYTYEGFLQKGEGSYFNRDEQMMTVNFAVDSTKNILKAIRSFGITGQGVTTVLKGKPLVIYDAAPITNTYLLNAFSNEPAGAVVLEYDRCILAKAYDGLIKIKRFEPSHV